MPRLRSFMWVPLTALAVGTVVSASASAAQCKAEGGGSKFALCFNEPLELEEGTFKLHVNDDPTTPTKEFILKGAEIEIRCPEMLLQLNAVVKAGTAIRLGVQLSGLVAHFIHCVIPKPEHCAINNELILTTTLDAVPTPKAEDKMILFLPEEGARFTTIKLENSGGTCIISGSVSINALNDKESEGPLCNSAGGEVTTILHLTECPGGPGKTNLGLLGTEVEVKGNCSVLLEGQKTKWAIILGR